MLHKTLDIIFGKTIASALTGAAETVMPGPSFQMREKQLEREYIEREARVGGEVFGKIPSGRTRQFFCLDQHTWIWHEAWNDERGLAHSFTINYEVRPDGIFKRVNGSGQLSKVTGDELSNFNQAIHEYRKRVIDSVYNQPVTA